MPTSKDDRRRHLRSLRRELDPAPGRPDRPNPLAADRSPDRRPDRPPDRRPDRRAHRAGRRPRWALLLLSVGALLALYLLWPRAGQEPEFVAANPGTVEVAAEADALVVRTEQVYTAPRSGTVQSMVEGGQRVRVGDPVVSIAAAGAPVPEPLAVRPTAVAVIGLRHEFNQISQQLYSLALLFHAAIEKSDSAEIERVQAEMDRLANRQSVLAAQIDRGEPAPAPTALREEAAGSGQVSVDRAGIVVYTVDGLEGQLIPSQSSSWTPAWYRSLALPNPRKTGQGAVSVGAPLFKLVDNLNPGLVLLVPSELRPSLQAERRIRVQFPGRDWRPIRATVIHHAEEGADLLLYLQASVLPEELNSLRKVRVRVVLASYSGLIAPRSAIDVQDGRQGVWVKDAKELYFQPVRVLGGSSTEVALEGAITPGAMILRVAPPRGAHPSPGLQP